MSEFSRTPNAADIGHVLARRRKDAGLNQGEAARALASPRSQAYVCLIERGQKRLPLSLLYDFARVYSCAVTDILRDAERCAWLRTETEKLAMLASEGCPADVQGTYPDRPTEVR